MNKLLKVLRKAFFFSISLLLLFLQIIHVLYHIKQDSFIEVSSVAVNC